jgi:hypothetical protein
MLSIIVLDFEAAILFLQFGNLLLELFQLLLSELLVHHEVLLSHCVTAAKLR